MRRIHPKPRTSEEAANQHVVDPSTGRPAPKNPAVKPTPEVTEASADERPARRLTVSPRFKAGAGAIATSPRTRRVALVAVLVVTAIGGFYFGASRAPTTASSIQTLVLTRLPDDGPHPNVQQATRYTVLRLDRGDLAVLGPEGYSAGTLAPDSRSLALALLADRSNWKSSYPVGKGEQHWSLDIGGPNAQTITFDDALANPALPYDLYRLVLELIRPNFEGNASPVPSVKVDELLR